MKKIKNINLHGAQPIASGKKNLIIEKNQFKVRPVFVQFIKKENKKKKRKGLFQMTFSKANFTDYGCFIVASAATSYRYIEDDKFYKLFCKNFFIEIIRGKELPAIFSTANVKIH